MEKLNYIVEDSTIAELLGIQNFTNKEAAILELVKNSFDADAKNIDIVFENNVLTVSDNGIGMNREDIINYWMHVGKSDKGYEITDESGEKRVLAGAKGIGRFALARLGENVTVLSKKEGYENVIWKTNWNTSTILENERESGSGTIIKIEHLRDKWTHNMAKKLAEYLAKTYNDNKMDITIRFEDDEYKVVRCFENPIMGLNYSSEIKMSYLSGTKKLICTINSDEFKDEACQYCGDTNIKYFETEINMYDELDVAEFGNEVEDLNRTLEMLGDFDAELYFGIKTSQEDANKFLYKRTVLTEKYSEGIILYRNSFSISSYEGKKDWLELGKRSRRSTAAASHPTGAWRVRENQIAGKVVIDKKRNMYLKDLSNRQGLDENEYYEVFVKIIQKGLEQFEYYRQSIIRKINAKKNVNDQQENEKKMVDKIISAPKALKELSNEDTRKLVSELKLFKRESTLHKKEIDTTEQRYKYDVRILNVLATTGLKAASIAHEMKNDRNSIQTNYDYIVKALKKYDMWELLCEEDKTKHAYQNVPELLNRNRKINQKIVVFMDTMLNDIQKKQFYAEEYNIYQLVTSMKDIWQRDYAWINIEIESEKELVYKLAEDILKVILDNLILNSVQQNDTTNCLNIEIKIEEVDKCLKITYKDNGIGLHRKYWSNPYKILEVHETSRKDGHGLGMWIVNNTVLMSGGKIIKISGENGFSIEFTIGGKV